MLKEWKDEFKSELKQLIDRSQESSEGLTPSRAVDQLRQRCPNVTTMADEPGEAPSFTPEELTLFASAKDEHHFDVLMTPHLQRLCDTHETLVNSEHYVWDWDQGGKPDFFISFGWQPRLTPKYPSLVENARHEIEQSTSTHYVFGVPWPALMDCVKVLESKLAMTQADLLQLWGYLKWLPDGASRGLLFDVVGFVCLEACGKRGHKEPLRIIDGKWETRGSWGRVRQFLQGSSVPASLISACLDDAEATLVRFLGKGTFGRVFCVRRGAEEVAVKIVQDADRAVTEFDSLQEAYNRGCPVVKALGGSVSRVNGGGYYCMTPVGCNVDKAFAKAHLQTILKSLHVLHTHGLVHGDARIQNIIFAGDKFFWIDFSASKFLATPQHIAADIKSLAMSLGAPATFLSSVTSASLQDEKLTFFALSLTQYIS
jgi:predicted Ser/Thr protein kinase